MACCPCALPPLPPPPPQVVEGIVAEGPEGARVLSTMAFTIKAAAASTATAGAGAMAGGSLAGAAAGLLTRAYAAAADKHPRDEEILQGLYRAYVR